MRYKSPYVSVSDLDLLLLTLKGVKDEGSTRDVVHCSLKRDLLSVPVPVSRYIIFYTSQTTFDSHFVRSYPF